MNQLAPHSLRALKGLLHRTAEVMNEETALLSSNPNANVAALAVRKNRFLFELSIAMDDMIPGQFENEIISDLEVLKLAAEKNERALSIQMAAAKDVIGILGSLADANAYDGTYAPMRG